jgi:hypothetical protein
MGSIGMRRGAAVTELWSGYTQTIELLDELTADGHTGPSQMLLLLYQLNQFAIIFIYLRWSWYIVILIFCSQIQYLCVHAKMQQALAGLGAEAPELVTCIPLAKTSLINVPLAKRMPQFADEDGDPVQAPDGTAELPVVIAANSINRVFGTEEEIELWAARRWQLYVPDLGFPNQSSPLMRFMLLIPADLRRVYGWQSNWEPEKRRDQDEHKE